ncbi:hypothetical protein UlMin_003542 [Ulmus minor]
MAEIVHSIVEQREELMVSTNGALKHISRTTHFLKSPQNSIDQLSPQLSSQTLPKNLSLEGIFCGWRSPHKNWKPWVDLLMPKYELLWKKAEIFEAIRISTFQVPKTDFFLLGILQKWNSESKSFLFPWGEATIRISTFQRDRIALAPTVVSFINKDLSSLKTCKQDDSVIKLWSPFQLVHLWILGRFLALQPQDNAVVFSGWQKVEKRRLESIRQALDSDGMKFLWRPYVRNCASFGLARFYGEEEMLVSISSGLDEETKSFSRCLRVSQLVGLDYVKEYLPHRVGRQFGVDQDVPGCLVQSDGTPKVAWEDYCKPVGCEKLYIPLRHFEGDVTIK